MNNNKNEAGKLDQGNLDNISPKHQPHIFKPTKKRSNFYPVVEELKIIKKETPLQTHLQKANKLETPKRPRKLKE